VIAVKELVPNLIVFTPDLMEHTQGIHSRKGHDCQYSAEAGCKHKSSGRQEPIGAATDGCAHSAQKDHFQLNPRLPRPDPSTQ
jgi:hypothetical protein